MTYNNVREEALGILDRVEREGAYSHLLLNHVLNQRNISKKDAPLLTELVYGTIKRKNTLDYYLSFFIKKGTGSLDSWVLQLLRMSLYQFIYLDRVPDRAAVHEAVNIAKTKGHKGISSLVNGVLRTIQREGLPKWKNMTEIEELSLETSHPVWLLEDWIKAYGKEEAKSIAWQNLETPKVSVRVNTLKATRETVQEKLAKEGYNAEPGALTPESLTISAGSIIQSEVFKSGYVTIQDESSMLPARLLNPESGMNVVDACAAPGGKTTHIAELMKNKGRVLAFDLHPKKVKLIEEQAERLGITMIKADALDARKLATKFETEQFDRILVDAPCSGLGVIRRKPELKWQKDREDLERFPDVQLRILQEAARLLKKGGRLVYSTCTIRREENEEVVEAFLKKEEGFERDIEAVEHFPEVVRERLGAEEAQVTILPHYFGTDGFYLAAMKRT